MKTRSQSKSLSTKTHEHDIETRSIAVGIRKKGDSFHAIGKQLVLSYSTVRNVIMKYQATGSSKNKTRCGRPQKLKAEHLEMLRHMVLEDRISRTMPLTGITMKLNDMLTTDVSQRTVRRALKEQGIKCHPAAVKPFVSKKNAAKRVAWCKERLNWKVKDWEKVYVILYLILYLILLLGLVYLS